MIQNIKKIDDEALLRTLIGMSPDLVWVKDENGIYLHCNKRFEQFFGKKVDEIIGRSDYDFVDKELADFFREHDKKAIDNGSSSVNEEELTFTSDGHKEWVETIKTPVFGEDGNLIGVMGISRDITERKKSEDMFYSMSRSLEKNLNEQVSSNAELERTYYEIYDGSQLGIVIGDMDANIIHANKSATQMLGYNLDELVGKHPLEISPDIQPTTDLFSSIAMKEIVERVVREGVNDTFEWTHIHKNGHGVLLEVTISLFGRDRDRFLVFWRDIGEISKLKSEKKSQELLLMQQSKLAEMGEMIGAIAHQWKQPINAIYMNVSMIYDLAENSELTPEETLKYAANIKKHAEFMNQTINDFRNFMRPDSEKVVFIPCDIIGEILRMFGYMFIKNDIEIIIHEHEHIKVAGYPNEMKQIILNLLKNASDAFAERKPIEKRVDVHIRGVDKKGYISISDTAGGIPESLLPNRLFEPYVSTKGDKGTGIGLQLVKKIVTEHFGGEIRAFNGENGAIFEIALPLFES